MHGFMDGKSTEYSPSWRTKKYLVIHKLHTFYETRKFITVLTTSRDLSLDSAIFIQSTPSHLVCLRQI
jgi:hypothetical protein